MPKLRRRLPPELLAEIHKCLPLADAINVLVNVPTRAIYQNNSPRMRRTIQRIKTSLNEYVATFYESAEENEIEDMVVYSDELKWKPELGALLRYGKWMTSKRELLIGARGNSSGNIVGVPENFFENLLLHLSNSCSTQIMLERVQIKFGRAKRIALPKFLKQLFSAKNQYRIGGRILFEPIELKAENGQTLCIHDGEMVDDIFGSGGYELKMIVVNKVDRKKWFNISLNVNSSRKFIRSLQWKLQALDDIAEIIQIDSIKQNYNYNKMKLEQNIYWNYRLDMFLRRGAIFTQFRHFNFKIKEPSLLNFYPVYYADFLFNYISNTKHPEEFLESVDINFDPEPNYSALFDDEFWKDCYKYKYKGIPKAVCPKFTNHISLDRARQDASNGGKYINSADKKKLHILSIKNAQSDNKLEFTLANIPTKGAYEFDVDVQFEKGPTQIIGIKIQRRKNDDVVELKCQHEIELGKKRKATYENGEEDQPTYSRKIIKK